jgi:hypothetical protein
MELGPSANPRAMSPAPASLVFFDRDPIATGSYEPSAGTTVRGSVIPTLGGVVIQDFGVNVQDQRINISDEAAFTKATVDALTALYIVSSGRYYFTDGYSCWEVQFARPDGFMYRRNLLTSFYNTARFDYEIKLVVKDTENV